MSWGQQWGGGSWPQNVITNPTQDAVNASALTPEQWATFQQQNWQQWIQWQQQYQTWQHQYGQEYQKSMNALTSQPPIPVVSQSQPPLPPADKAPPLPPNQSTNQPLPPVPPEQPQTAALTQMVPLVVNFNVPPPTIAQKNPQSIQKNFQPNSNYVKGALSTNSTSANLDKKSYGMGQFSKNFGSTNSKKLDGPNLNENHNFGNFGLSKNSGMSASVPKGPLENQSKTKEWTTSDHESIKLMELIDELIEAEKVFDKQFEDWEAQFNRWKEQNVQHPDKEQYRQYEAKWENWRKQLLDRREQMRKRKTTLMNTLQKNKSGMKPTSEEVYDELAAAAVTENIDDSKRDPVVLDWEDDNAQDSVPDFESTAPKEQRQNRRRPSCIEGPENSNSFLNSSTNTNEGIPGLDLVKSDEDLKPNQETAPDLDKKTDAPVTDFEALSKGINQILGDPNLINMLSSMKNNKVFETEKEKKLEKTEVSSVDSSFNNLNWPNVDFNKPPPDFQPKNPNFGGQNPNFGGQNPNFGSQNPNIGAQNSNIGAQNPNFGSQNPNIGAQNPNIGAQNPNFGGQSSKFGGQNPNLGAQNSNFGGQNLNIGGQSSKFGGQNPNLGAQNPNIGGQNSKFGGQNPNLGGQNPNNRGQNFNFGGQNSFEAQNKVIKDANKQFESPNQGYGGQNPNFDSQYNNSNNQFGGKPKNLEEQNQNFGGQNLNAELGQNSGPRPLMSIPPPSFIAQKNLGGPNQNPEHDNFGGQNRNIGNQNRNFGGQNSNVEGQKPNFGGPNPNFEGKNNFGEQNSFGGQSTNFGNKNQSFGNQNSSFANQNPNFNNQNPNFRNQNPNFGNQNPNFRNQNPTFGNQNPNFRGQNPQFGGPNPNFSGQKSNFGGQNPHCEAQNFQNSNLKGQNWNNQNYYDDDEEDIENMDDPFPDDPELENDNFPASHDNNWGNKKSYQENPSFNSEAQNRNDNSEWDEALIFKPVTVIDYGHKSLNRPEDKLFIEPVQTFDYGHTSTIIEKPKSDHYREAYDKPYYREPTKEIQKTNLRYEKEPNVSDSSNFERNRERNYRTGLSYDRDRDRTQHDVENKYRDEKKYQDKYYDFDRKRYDEKSRYEEKKRYNYDDRAYYEDKSRSANYSRRETTRNRSRSPLNRRGANSGSRPVEKDKNAWNKEKMLNQPIIDMLIESNTEKESPVTLIDDLLLPPGRSNRPPRLVIIMRGPPGSGKTFLAKLIKDKEVEMGGSAPRILSLDDYFMVENEEEVIEEGRKIKKKKMIYEYEEGMENAYRQSLEKAFKKTITDGYFQFIILDCVNDKIKHFSEMWSFAKQNGFQVYICQMELELANCTRRNIHFRSEIEIDALIKNWEPTPSHFLRLDATSLLQSGCIPTVEMTIEIDSSEDNFDSSDNEDEGTQSQHISKWEKMEHTDKQLAQLDGTNKPLRHSSKTMEDYLQWEDQPDQPDQPDKPGVKKVRWADLEERRKQEKMRAIGFVVGQTDWHRMMDPTQGGSALTQTKYIERHTPFNRKY